MLKKASITPTRPQARQGAPLPDLRSRLKKILNVPSREGARLGALGGGWVRRSTSPVFYRLRPCWIVFLSILLQYSQNDEK